MNGTFTAFFDTLVISVSGLILLRDSAKTGMSLRIMHYNMDGYITFPVFLYHNQPFTCILHPTCANQLAYHWKFFHSQLMSL